MNKKNETAILNFWWAANYGANLTAYAIQQLIPNSILVDTSDSQQVIRESFQNFHCNFAKKYLEISKPCHKILELKNLNAKCEMFIVGSDQVFRPNINKRIADLYLLDFLDAHSKKMAFSASFGVDKQTFLQENSKQRIAQMKKSLKSFDLISVREKSGVEICRDLLDVAAEWIIDPVFILDKEYYTSIAEQSKLKVNNAIVSYMFDKENNKVDDYLAKKYSKKVIELCNSNCSVEDWLNAIKNCEILITNSYHAMCFALIFNKPFICVVNSSTGATRYESIMEMLGIEYQCIENINEVYVKDCVFKVDWQKVNQKIEIEKRKGIAFLQKGFDIPVSKSDEKIEAKIQFLENKVFALEAQSNLKYQIKNELWRLWLVFFYKYFPCKIKNMFRKIRQLKQH